VLKITFYEPWEKIGVKLSFKKYARTKKYVWVITVWKLSLELKVSTKQIDVDESLKNEVTV
jgi:hypothetical protein